MVISKGTGLHCFETTKTVTRRKHQKPAKYTIEVGPTVVFGVLGSVVNSVSVDVRKNIMFFIQGYYGKDYQLGTNRQRTW